MTERTPPYSEEAEKGALGSMLPHHTSEYKSANRVSKNTFPLPSF